LGSSRTDENSSNVRTLQVEKWHEIKMKSSMLPPLDPMDETTPPDDVAPNVNPKNIACSCVLPMGAAATMFHRGSLLTPPDRPVPIREDAKENTTPTTLKTYRFPQEKENTVIAV
jgi:hypothetical protein